MARKFQVEIITPERVAFSGDAESLVVPASGGYLGVLAGHAPLLATLRPGEVQVRSEGRGLRIAVSGGFMEVTPGRTSILTDGAEEVEKIDLPRAQRALQRARERLASTEASVDQERARAALERARNRLRRASPHGT